MEATTQAQVAALDWSPSPRVIRTMRCLQVGVIWAGFGAAALSLFQAGLAMPVTSVFLMFASAIVVHELGHLVGARIGGMTPYEVHILGTRWMAGSTFWRGRVTGRFALNQAMAFPDPDRPLRPQWFAMVLGGPLANLVVAMMASVVALATTSSVRHVALSFFATNLAYFVANLLPTEAPRPSDGLHLLRLRRPGYEQDPRLVILRLAGMSLRGTTATEIPDALLSQVAAGPDPQPLIARWFEFKRHEARGEGLAAVAEGEGMLVQSETLDANLRKQMEEFLAAVRVGIRGAQGMAGLPMAPLPERRLLSNIAWSSPGFVERVEAVEALCAGDAARVRRKLADAERKARASIDTGYQRTEAAYRAAILARLESA